MNLILQLEVEGDTIQVAVEEIPHRHHNMIRASFKNGYENIFFTDAETGEWIEEDLGFTELAAALGKMINKHLRSPYHVPKLLTWHNQFINGRYFKFGFFPFLYGNQKLFQIYNANRKYLYTLSEMDNEEWQILGNANNLYAHIDIFFLQKIIKTLPLYSPKVP